MQEPHQHQRPAGPGQLHAQAEPKEQVGGQADDGEGAGVGVLQDGPLLLRGGVALEGVHRVHEAVQVDAAGEEQGDQGHAHPMKDRAEGKPAPEQEPQPFRPADHQAHQGQGHQHVADLLPLPGHLGRGQGGEHGEGGADGIDEVHTVSPFKQIGMPATSS